MLVTLDLPTDFKGRGGGPDSTYTCNVHAFYSDNQSSNPALRPQLLAAKNGAKDEKEIGIVPYLKRPIHSLAH